MMRARLSRRADTAHILKKVDSATIPANRSDLVALMDGAINSNTISPGDGRQPVENEKAGPNAYKRLLKTIDAGDQAGADAELAQLEVTNLYEDAYNNVARYQYHLKWGTEAHQLADLARAVAGENLPRYLPDDVFIRAVRSCGLELVGEHGTKFSLIQS